MKKITFLIALFGMLLMSTVTSYASDLVTSGSVGVYSRYFDHGYDQSNGKAFSTLSGTVAYDALSVSVLAKQSISGQSGYNGIEGSVDYALSKNASFGVRSYSIADVRTDQDLDAHISLTDGAFTINAERRIAGINTSGTYGELVITTHPIKNIDVQVVSGVGNKIYTASNDLKFQLVNEAIVIKTNVANDVSVFGTAVYNSALHQTFKTNDILYGVGLSVNL